MKLTLELTLTISEFVNKNRLTLDDFAAYFQQRKQEEDAKRATRLENIRTLGAAIVSQQPKLTHHR